MAPESDNNLRLEIGHVLFIDLVGYSKLLIEDQKERMRKLTDIVLATPQVLKATNEKLVRLPTGDGMALVFRDSSEEPAQCALEISKALQEHPEMSVRMGIHSGPVSEVSDVNERTNIAGAGINVAQRVMDCGDGGHILLSRRVADDLAQYRQWSSHLHDLGECEVKHGVTLGLVNLYTSELGNPETPEKLKCQTPAPKPIPVPARAGPGLRSKPADIALIVLAALVLTGGALFFFLRGRPALPNEKSIAVLPFENLSEDKANAYFADGIQDEILTRLSKIADLKVISRTSTERYKSAPASLLEIGRQLGVANILEGSVQKSGGQVRVNVQLIKTTNDSHLWAESYDRELRDIFKVETEVATAVADKLRATLTGSETQVLASKPTANLDAYDAYLHGLDFDRRSESTSDLLKATEYLQSAVKLDPTFALAWARLARVKANLYYQDVDTTLAWRAATEEAVKKAVELAPDLGETSLALGYFRFFCERNLALARSAFEAARLRLPNDSDLLLALSLVDLHQGRAEDALALQTQSLRLDPRNPFLFFKKALTLAALRRFPEARAAVDLALALNTNDPQLLGFKASTYHAEGNLDEALKILDQVPAEDKNGIYTRVRVLNSAHRYSDVISILQPAVDKNPASTDLTIATFYDFLGRAQKAAGDPIAARATFLKGRDLVLANIAKSGGPQGRIHAVLGLMHSGLGEKEAALREANRAVELEGDDLYFVASAKEVLARIEVEVGDPSHALDLLPEILQANAFSWETGVPLTVALIRLDPTWDPIRNDPRFQKLIVGAEPTTNH